MTGEFGQIDDRQKKRKGKGGNSKDGATALRQFKVVPRSKEEPAEVKEPNVPDVLLISSYRERIGQCSLLPSIG